jgi:hypothetical protein
MKDEINDIVLYHQHIDATDESDFYMGLTIGLIIGVFISGFTFAFIINPVNIDYDHDYQTIDVVKITIYSNGEQILETSAYTQIFGIRLSNNYTYLDSKGLINSLGLHKVKLSEYEIRSIISTISIVEVIEEWKRN